MKNKKPKARPKCEECNRRACFDASEDGLKHYFLCEKHFAKLVQDLTDKFGFSVVLEHYKKGVYVFKGCKFSGLNSLLDEKGSILLEAYLGNCDRLLFTSFLPNFVCRR